jgi:hypothetical protein
LAHGRKIERAYVSGSAVIQSEPVDDFPIPPGAVVLRADDGIASKNPRKILKPRWLLITVDNHGKTPAFISDIAVALCPTNELPAIPEYLSAKRFADLRVSPGTVGLRTQFQFDFQQAGGKLVYGRIYYTDIFREEHSSGFILQVLSSTTGAFGAAPEYTAWD